VTRRAGVVVLDDYFPRLSTGFRVAEFSWMLRHGVVSEVLTTAGPIDLLLDEYDLAHPGQRARIRSYDVARLAGFELASVVFLNNVHHYLDDLEHAELPFVLTLYPGGGLQLGDAGVEAKLQRVLASPLIRHVVTTQPIVTDHVRESAPGLPLTEIVGVPVGREHLFPGAGLRPSYFLEGKDSLDVCFVAQRYTADGRDKGFPTFLETVQQLSDDGLPVRGHVVGGFDMEQVPDGLGRLDLTFHGVLSTGSLRQFFSSQDVIVSLPVPGVLAPGAFDGFPTASCVEAALNGVAIVSSDPLDQNRVFQDGRDIHVTGGSALEAAGRVRAMLAEPGGLRRVGQAGMRTARRAYGVGAQLIPRRTILESLTSRPDGSLRR